MTILDISNLTLTLPDTARPVLSNVSLSIGETETVALVGESGSGKTLTARSVIRLLPHGARVTGTVKVAGQDVLTMDARTLTTLRVSTAAMIFQDPRASINPLRRIGDFLTETIRARDKAVEMLARVGLPVSTAAQYPGALSGGMLQRVMIAATLMGDPKLILADEPTTALDVTTQAEVIALLTDLKPSLLFVTHDLGLASAISDRVYVMYAGRIVETGTADDLFSNPRHPYTRALLNSSPRIDGPARRLTAIDGYPPDLRTPLTGCPFAPRCPLATAICTEQEPQPVNHVACHHA
ncbi:MAG TPA: ABC transporter ATP-binding protein [Streptosporangiaceae bacterium]|nr:ABC transporter ATP-binding protein [Streptosporangiaceae bacterium]